MNEKQFYYLKGREQFGPYSIEELQSFDLNPDTYIWTESMDNWEKIKNIPELLSKKTNTKTPPPPPEIDNNSINIDKNGDENEFKPKLIVENSNQSINGLTILIIWSSCHLFALLMSYSRIDLFNNFGWHKTDKFWPFVSYFTKARMARGFSAPDYFNGIFTQYDWTEFAFYVGIGIVMYTLSILNKKK